MIICICFALRQPTGDITVIKVIMVMIIEIAKNFTVPSHVLNVLPTVTQNMRLNAMGMDLDVIYTREIR